MKWKSRSAQIARLRAKYRNNPYTVAIPNLKEGLADRKVAPCSNNFDAIGGYARAEPFKPNPPGLIVDCLHKSSLQVILPSEITMIGRKP